LGSGRSEAEAETADFGRGGRRNRRSSLLPSSAVRNRFWFASADARPGRGVSGFQSDCLRQTRRMPRTGVWFPA